jgi:hypothetical protein
MLFKEPYPGFDGFWQKAIVTIKKQNILASAVGDTGVMRRR